MSPGCSSGDLGFTASRRSLDMSERVKGLECGVQGLPVCNDSFRCFETPLVIIMYSLSEFASRQPRGLARTTSSGASWVTRTNPNAQLDMSSLISLYGA